MPATTDSRSLPKPKSPWWPLFLVASGVIGALLLVRWAVLMPDRKDASTVAFASGPADPIGWALTEVASTDGDSGDASRWERFAVLVGEAATEGPEKARAFINALFGALDAKSPGERLALMGPFFESGVDVRLGLDFVVGPGGYLTEWPTLRVAMFDYLAMRDGAAARMLTLGILDKRPDLPAEWAVALRELVRGVEVDAWPELAKSRLHDLVHDTEWRASSPPGWREGLELVGAGKAFDYLPVLSELTQGPYPRTTQLAAFLAAERLMNADPGQFLEELNRAPELFGGSTSVRAGLFARADVRATAQLQALEAYFVRPDVHAGERMHLGSLFPYHKPSTSPGLLTPSHSRPDTDLRAQDKATLPQIERWLGEPEYSEWHGALADVKTRLNHRIESGF